MQFELSVGDCPKLCKNTKTRIGVERFDHFLKNMPLHILKIVVKAVLISLNTVLPLFLQISVAKLETIFNRFFKIASAAFTIASKDENHHQHVFTDMLMGKGVCEICHALQHYKLKDLIRSGICYYNKQEMLYSLQKYQ